MFLKGFVVAAFVSVTFASIAHGPCKDAKKGGVYEKCYLDCDLDGSCSEFVATETCDCKNSAEFIATTYNFKNGTVTTSVGKRKKRSIFDVISPLKACDKMKRRCKDCISKKKNNAPKGSAEAWKTKNESC